MSPIVLTLARHYSTLPVPGLTLSLTPHSRRAWAPSGGRGESIQSARAHPFVRHRQGRGNPMLRDGRRVVSAIPIALQALATVFLLTFAASMAAARSPGPLAQKSTHADELLTIAQNNGHV